MEIKKIKKLLLSLAVVALFTGCGSDDDTPAAKTQSGDTVIEGANYIQIGKKGAYSVWQPLNIVVGSAEGTYSVKSAQAGELVLVDGDDENKAPKTYSEKELHIRASVKGLGADAANKVTIYAFSKVEVHPKTAGGATDDGIKDESLKALETAASPGVKVVLKGGAQISSNNVVDVDVYLGTSTALNAKYPLTTKSDSADLGEILIVVKKGAPHATATSATPASVKIINPTDDAAEPAADADASGTVEVLDTENHLPAKSDDNTAVDPTKIADSKGNTGLDDDCADESSESDQTLAITAGAKHYSHFGRRIASGACNAIDDWTAQTIDTNVKAVPNAVPTTETPDANVNFGVKVENASGASVEVSSILVEEKKAAASTN